MKKSYTLKDVDCANCAAKIENALKKIDGVSQVAVSFMMQKVTIEAPDDRFAEVLTEAKKIVKKAFPGTTFIA